MASSKKRDKNKKQTRLTFEPASGVGSSDGGGDPGQSISPARVRYSHAPVAGGSKTPTKAFKSGKLRGKQAKQSKLLPSVGAGRLSSHFCIYRITQACEGMPYSMPFLLEKGGARGFCDRCLSYHYMDQNALHRGDFFGSQF